MSDESTPTERAIAALTSEDSPLRGEGMDLLLDHGLGLELSALIEVEPFVELILAALADASWWTLLDRQLPPAWSRLLERTTRTAEKVGDLLPESASAEIEEIVIALRLPEAAWAKRAIDGAAVRRLLAPIMQDVLLGFAKKLPLPGIGAAPSGKSRASFGIAGRLAKSVGESAERFADVGKAMMGGIDKKVAALAKDFSQGAVDELKGAFATRLQSPEGRELLTQIQRHFLAELNRTPLEELLADAEALPSAEVAALIRPVLAHNAAREIFAMAIRAELRAVVEIESERSLGELLEEAGVKDEVLAHLREILDREARGFFAKPEVTDWMRRLLEG